MESKHSGHRSRMFAKLERFGPEIFEDHELLEMLLYFCIPRVDTNLIAHRLIDSFGSLSNVLSASSTELMSVEGIGPHSAKLIRTVSGVFSRYNRTEKSKQEIFDTVEKIGMYFCDLFFGEEQEKMYAMYLDMHGRQIATVNIAVGDISKLDVIPSLVINNATRYKSANVVIAHNHPRGNCSASAEDINSTLKLRYALSCAGINLLEHFAIGENGYFPIMEENKNGI